MKAIETEKYMLGMAAVNNFFNMLYQSILAAMPGVQLRGNGAYGWRGYQITRYEDLAEGQYYCEIYQEPHSYCWELSFQECFRDSAYQPHDEYERELGIKTKEYVYPFRVSLDLYKSRFFKMNISEQMEMLKNFISYASQQALIWQRSDARAIMTPKNFKSGREINPKGIKNHDIQQVNMEFMTVWSMQHSLFEKMSERLNDLVPKITRKKIDWIRVNTSPTNFGYRGMRQKYIDRSESDYLWAIYYDEPELLRCLWMESKKIINSYNIRSRSFFDLDEKTQDKELDVFIEKCLTT